MEDLKSGLKRVDSSEVILHEKIEDEEDRVDEEDGVDEEDRGDGDGSEVNDGGTETEDIEDEDEEEGERVEVCEFVYKNKTYYYEKDDVDNKVYNNSELEEEIGKWGVTKSGKMKFIKAK